jgi:hypothetical protein
MTYGDEKRRGLGASMRLRALGALGAASALTLGLGAWGCATGTLTDGSSSGLDASTGTDDDATTAADGKAKSPDAKTVTFQDGGFPANDSGGSMMGPGDAGDDSQGPEDAAPDVAGPGDSSTSCPVGTTGPGCADCASGFHLCKATCTADGPNNPGTGCSQSCGGACPASGDEVASCTAAGACAAGCAPGLTLCPGTTTCSTCCSNSDCSGSTPLCSGGACTACPYGYGTCSTACDTDLTTADNCGFCGDSCDYDFFECSLFGDECGDCDGSGSDPSGYSCD